ncbi:MAG: hypothetical protein K0R66_780 [Gammaproteobacteria bacterium]|jgi:small-conductance mechanosensitive channel|nr:hypothetical protein [Gammaproteobacteria bacterium]
MPQTSIPGFYIPGAATDAASTVQTVGFSKELLVSGIIVLVLWLCYLLARIWINHHFDNLKQRYTWRTRAFYMVLLVSFYFMGRVWIDDPQHIITFLSIIAAALTLTQKETIMNLVGWALIYGRDLFATGNRVQIMNYYGDVTAMGLFYFNLLECNPNLSGDQTTGRIIRVPNGLVITNPVVNFSDAFPFIWHEFKALLTMDSDHEKASYILKQIIDQRVHPYYEEARKHLDHYTKDNFVAEQQLSTQTFLMAKFAAPAGIEITIRYLCYPSQANKLESEIWQEFLKELQTESKIKLAHA